MSSQDSRLTPPEGVSIYEQFGGEEAISRLVRGFYKRVEMDDALRSMFPDELDETIRRLTLFLVQLFGGPTTYSQERGHPRLRMRHAPFPITPEAGQRWLTHMLAALDEETREDASADRALASMQIRQYFERATGHLVNQQEE